jgi:hypothetical protein
MLKISRSKQNFQSVFVSPKDSLTFPHPQRDKLSDFKNSKFHLHLSPLFLIKHDENKKVDKLYDISTEVKIIKT